MARPLRIEFPGATYHVMNRGLAARPIFHTDADRMTFLEGLAEVHARWGLRTFAYCLMGNHYHLCVETPHGPLSRIMRHVDGVYTQRYNGMRTEGVRLEYVNEAIVAGSSSAIPTMP